MHLRPLLLVVLGSLAFSACDVVEPDPPPVEPPPAVPVHPYGAGNGKVMFVSDLAVAERIDVTLAGSVIGAVTKFVGCPSRVTSDDSLAVAIRPAGRYQYSARSTTGTTWATSSVQIDEDGLKRVTFIGRPSQYAVHLPAEIEGVPAAGQNDDRFHYSTGEDDLRLTVSRPPVVQGDRIDVVLNGSVVARRVALGTEPLSFDIPLAPGPNYVAVRLSQDADGDGAGVDVQLYSADSFVGHVHISDNSSASWLRTNRWSGVNLRYSC